MNCPTCSEPLEKPAECKCGWRGDAAPPAPPAPAPGLLVNAGGKPVGPAPAGAGANFELRPDVAKNEQGAKAKKGEQNPFRQMDADRDSEAGGRSYDPNQFFEKLRSRTLAVGHGNTIIDKLIFESGKEAEGEKGDKKARGKKSYLDVVSVLHLRSGLELPEFELDALTRQLAEMKRSRLLVVNCFDDDLADAAASELIGSLDPDGAWQKFYLDCDRDDLDDADLRVELFTNPESESKTPSVVLVDASGKRGGLFLESLLGKPLKAQNVSGYLKSNKLWLICRGDSAHLRRRAPDDKKSLHFPCWEMDCLPELLQRHFPDRHERLRERIEKLRGADDWPDNEGALCSQVRGLIAGGRLEAEVSSLEQSGPPARRETDSRASFIRSHFKGGDSIEDTVLYVAAYFPDLNPHEFDRVVSALLEGLTTKVAVPAPKPAAGAGGKIEVKPDGGSDARTDGKTPAQGAGGEGAEPFVWEEQPLLRTWHDKADEILSGCRLETVVGKDAGRRLDFTDPALRQELRAYLEVERGFYLKKQFGRVQRLGLLFDRSLNISEGVLDVAVNTALESPETFSRDWLYDMVTALSPLIEAAAGEVVVSDGAAYRPALPADVEAAMRVVYSTVARLVRKMLAHPLLEKSLNNFFIQLMASGQHGAVLEIVRRLQTAQQSEVKWLRHLFDQGDEVIRLRAYFALYERVRQREAGIYEVLQALEPWLPERGREPFTYSPSNEYALRLMFEYCLNSTAEFDPKFYGSWPCRYPLLATPAPGTPEGERVTQGNLSLLAGWLFHPGLKDVLTEEEDGEAAESLNVSLGALLAEWAVILLGADVAAGERDGRGARPPADPPGDAVAVFDLLLKKVIAVTTHAQQNELIACWSNLADYFLWHLTTLGVQSGEPRRLLSRRRNWVRYVVKRFKVLRRQAA